MKKQMTLEEELALPVVGWRTVGTEAGQDRTVVPYAPQGTAWKAKLGICTHPACMKQDGHTGEHTQ